MLETTAKRLRTSRRRRFIRLMAETLPLAGYAGVRADLPGWEAPEVIHGAMRDHRPSLFCEAPKPVFLDVLSPGPITLEEVASRWQLFASAAELDRRRIPRRASRAGSPGATGAGREADRGAGRRPHRLHLDGLTGLAPQPLPATPSTDRGPRAGLRLAGRSSSGGGSPARAPSHRAQERPQIRRGRRLPACSVPALRPARVARQEAAERVGRMRVGDAREVRPLLAAGAADP